LRVDRPFVFVIGENESETAFFICKIIEPAWQAVLPVSDLWVGLDIVKGNWRKSLTFRSDKRSIGVTGKEKLIIIRSKVRR